MKKLWKQFIDNLETVLAVVVSIVAAVFGTFGVLGNFLLPAIAVSLALIATGLIRDRKVREALLSETQRLENSLNKLGYRPSADVFFKTKTSYLDVMAQASQEVWIIQETGQTIFNQPTPFQEFIQKGGKVKVILTGTEKHIINAVAFRNKDIKSDEIAKRHDSAKGEIESLRKSLGASQGNLEIKRLSYSLDITAIFADPQIFDTTKRIGLIRMVGFDNPFAEKRDFSISFSNEPETYQYFFKQIQAMWDKSI